MHANLTQVRGLFVETDSVYVIDINIEPYFLTIYMCYRIHLISYVRHTDENMKL